MFKRLTTVLGTGLAAAAVVLLLTQVRRPAPREVVEVWRDAPSSLPRLPLADSHAQLGISCAGCHFGRPSAQAARADGASALGAAGSQVCLSCHDGSMAGASMGVGHSSLGASWGPNGSEGHPVGTDYASAWRRRPEDYHPPGSPGIRLDEGKVGCASCHSAHEVPSGKTVCLSCHDR